MKRNSGWKSILRSAECREVLAQVVALRKKGERVYPIQKDVFRALEDCPFKTVRVVIRGQDPYANEGQAIGRAFAVSQRGYFCTIFVAIDQQHNPTLILLQSIHRAATVLLTYCHGSERMIPCLDELPDSQPLIAKY